MTARSFSATRKTAAVLSAALTASVLAAVPAHATIVSTNYQTASTTGSLAPTTLNAAITPAQIITRAQDWALDNTVPYNQDTGWIDTRVGGPYRTDCSGFVSMAWDLSSSYTTYTLPGVSHELTSGGAADYSQLQPGDILLWVGDPHAETGHVELFAGWENSAHTTAYVYQEPHSGKNAEYGTDTLADFENPDSTFLPYRYNNLSSASSLAAGAPVSLVTSDGTIAFYAVRSDGNVWGQSQSAVGGSFGGWQQLTTGGGFEGTPEAVMAADGAISVYAHGGNGSVWRGAQSAAYGAFTWTSLGGTSVDSDLSAVVLPSGAQAVYATATDGNVWGQSQATAGGAFGGWQQLTTAGGFTGQPSAVVAQNGTTQVFARATNGSVSWASQATAGGAFTWSSLGGTTVSGDPTAAVMPNGTIEVYITSTDGNVWGQSQATVGGAFGGWQQLSTGGGDIGKPAALLTQTGIPVIYAETSAGSVNAGTQASDGTVDWTSLGGGSIASDPSAVVASGNLLAVYITATDGNVWGDGQDTTGGTFTGWVQLN